MRNSLRFLLPIAAFLLVGSLAFGQNVVNCSSNDMGYHTCQIGPNSGVRMVQQLSGSPCIQGRTFGVTRDSIWVNRGCRANFQVLQNGYNGYNNNYNRQGAWNGYNGQYNRQGAENGEHERWEHRHHRHHREGQYSNGQYSNNGQYYPNANRQYYPNANQPYSNNGYGNNGYGPYYGASNNGYYGNYAAQANTAVQGHIIYRGNYNDGKATCSSQRGGGVIYCQSGGKFNSADLISQNGQTQCIEGQTWGHIPNKGLWVADGCSGQWKIHR